MKIGVCIVTCNRPTYLKRCITSLGENYNEIVVVNNGDAESILDVAVCLQRRGARGVTMLDGGQSNSPHGQNIGLHYLAKKGCDVILKSDDDIEYEKGYIKILMETFSKHFDKIGAICGTCWPENNYFERIRRHDDGTWYKRDGTELEGGIITMYRVESSVIVKVNHLHGGFLYRVKDALELEQRTKDTRGGAFPEYLSQVAHREETDFTLCLKQLLGRELIYDTRATCYHFKALGGIRKFDVEKIQLEDDKKFRKMMKKLNVKCELDEMDCGLLEDLE